MLSCDTHCGSFCIFLLAETVSKSSPPPPPVQTRQQFIAKAKHHVLMVGPTKGNSYSRSNHKANSTFADTCLSVVLMYVPCVLYSLLSRPTNAQHIRVCVCVCVYIYINNILFIVSAATCFDASASSSVGRNLVLAKVTKLLQLLALQQNKSSSLKCSGDCCCVIRSIKC